MAYQNRVASVTRVASTDLGSLQHRIVDLNATAFKVIDSALEGGFGVLQNNPNAGEHATIAIGGAVKVRGGVAVSVGDLISSAASGWAAVHTNTQVTSDTAKLRSKVILGRAVTAAASGSVFTLEMNIQTTMVLST